MVGPFTDLKIAGGENISEQYNFKHIAWYDWDIQDNVSTRKMALWNWSSENRFRQRWIFKDLSFLRSWTRWEIINRKKCTKAEWEKEKKHWEALENYKMQKTEAHVTREGMGNKEKWHMIGNSLRCPSVKELRKSSYIHSIKY